MFKKYSELLKKAESDIDFIGRVGYLVDLFHPLILSFIPD